jgi:hypothetical protein
MESLRFLALLTSALPPSSRSSRDSPKPRCASMDAGGPRSSMLSSPALPCTVICHPYHSTPATSHRHANGALDPARWLEAVYAARRRRMEPHA